MKSFPQILKKLYRLQKEIGGVINIRISALGESDEYGEAQIIWGMTPRENQSEATKYDIECMTNIAITRERKRIAMKSELLFDLAEAEKALDMFCAGIRRGYHNGSLTCGNGIPWKKERERRDKELAKLRAQNKH